MLPTELTDDRLRLRAPTLEDAPDIARACQDPDVARWIAVMPWPYTLADAEHFVREVVGPGWECGNDLVWSIRDRASDTMLGGIGLHRRMPGVAEVGFWLAAPARGRGVMTNAVGLVCEYAFAALDVQRVEWQAVVGNEASHAVATRAGFVHEGRLRGRLRHRTLEDPSTSFPADAWIAARLVDDPPARPGQT